MPERHLPDGLRPTYELAQDQPPAMTWEDYSRGLHGEWAHLLEDGQVPEREIQAFFERHTCMIPGAFGSIAMPSGHVPYPRAVITQPRLKGLGNRIPDFLWIARDSVSLIPTLVEIEAPGRRWFTGKGNPTAELTAARTQLDQWRAWFAHPENQLLFRATYMGWQYSEVPIRPHFVLIFGRRAEFDAAPQLREIRAGWFRGDETLMSYDRIRPDRDASQLLCVRLERDTEYVAVSVPPTLRLGPESAEDLSFIQEKERAVARNALLTPERKQFLIDRFQYWDSWLRETGGRAGIMDYEAIQGE